MNLRAIGAAEERTDQAQQRAVIFVIGVYTRGLHVDNADKHISGEHRNREFAAHGVKRVAAEGASTFVEIGPGRVLTGLLKRTVDGARGLSVEDPAGLERALAAVEARA